MTTINGWLMRHTTRLVVLVWLVLVAATSVGIGAQCYVISASTEVVVVKEPVVLLPKERHLNWAVLLPLTINHITAKWMQQSLRWVGRTWCSAYSKEQFPGITYSGRLGTPNLSCAVCQPKHERIVPLGTIIWLRLPNGEWRGPYIVDDTGRLPGGPGVRHLDIMTITTKEALQWGVKQVEVWKKEGLL